MKTVLISAALVLAASGAAFAQGPGPDGPGGRLMAADANKDGVITKAEFDANRTARFAEMDKNKDGFLTKDEMTADRPGGPPPGAMRAAAGGPNGGQGRGDLDANKDGKISKAEFLANTRMFDRMDANKDGKIDASEIAAMRARFSERGKGG